MKQSSFFILSLLPILLGCSKYFSYNDSEIAHLRSEGLIPKREILLDQVKYSSRDLNLCRQRVGEVIVFDTVNSLSREIDITISKTECVVLFKQLNFLINQAKDEGIRVKKINQSITDGRKLAEK